MFIFNVFFSEWTKRAHLMTFGDAVLSRINNLTTSEWKKRSMKQKWLGSDPLSLSNSASRQIADSLFGERDSVRN